MKKIILGMLLSLGLSTVAQAQEESIGNGLSKGRFMLETNTGFGNIHPGSTGINLSISNSQLSYNIGGEAGYFIADNFALKLGLGIGNFATGSRSISSEGGSEGSGSEGGSEGGSSGESGEGGSGSGEAGEGGVTTTGGSGRGGASIAGLGTILSYKIGAKYYLNSCIPLQVDFSGTSVSNYNHEIGFQGGYAFFLGDEKKISIEPGFRYSLPVTTRVGTIDNQFQFNVGFSLFL